MAQLHFDDVSPGDTVSYWHKIPGTTMHRYRVVQIRTVLPEDGIWLTISYERIDRQNIVEGSIQYAATPTEATFTDREGDTVTVGSGDQGVTMTIPGYGTMTFDQHTANRLTESMSNHVFRIGAKVPQPLQT